MKLLSLYKWLAGSKNDFLGQFHNNDQLYAQADKFWKTLEGKTILVLITAIVFGVLWAIYYYTAYNNKPGRHYKPRHWALFLAVTFVSTLIISYGLQIILVPSNLKGVHELEFLISLGNAVYASIIYFIVSIAWCYIGPTNAYRLFKFGKK